MLLQKIEFVKTKIQEQFKDASVVNIATDTNNEINDTTKVVQLYYKLSEDSKDLLIATIFTDPKKNSIISRINFINHEESTQRFGTSGPQNTNAENRVEE